MKEPGSRLDEESLRKFLCEAEFIIDNRSLTLETLNDPLSGPSASLGKACVDSIRRVCRKKWRHTQHVA